MYKKRGRKKKTGMINHKKTMVDGIQLASNLEAHMYRALKAAKIPFEYEKKSYVLMEGFHFPNKSYERQSNGRGYMVDRGGKKVRSITYLPDFEGDGWIIECKGYANDSFPLRYKLFKQLMKDEDVVLLKPQNRSECLEAVEIIKKLIKEKKNGK